MEGEYGKRPNIDLELPRLIEYNISIDSIQDGEMMAGSKAVKVIDVESNIVNTDNLILLKQFPPKLRKLAKHLLESDQPLTVSDACRDLNLNRASIGTLIYKSKQKGNDFVQFIEEQSKMLLHENRIGVYKAVIRGAVQETSTSHNQQKLFTLLVGDTKESTSINIGTLTVGVNVSALPVQDQRDKGVIDIEPYVPKGK